MANHRVPTGLCRYPDPERILSPDTVRVYREKLAGIASEAESVDAWIEDVEPSLNGRPGSWSAFPFVYSPDAHTPATTVTLDKRFRATLDVLGTMRGVKTAFFSRMQPGTVLKGHHGYSALSNHVYRVHFPVLVEREKSGLWVCGEKRFHELGVPLVMDDSLWHSGFNLASSRRVVLIVDVLRPEDDPRGASPETDSSPDAKRLIGTVTKLENRMRTGGVASRRDDR